MANERGRQIGERFQLGGDHPDWMPTAAQWYEITDVLPDGYKCKMVDGPRHSQTAPAVLSPQDAEHDLVQSNDRGYIRADVRKAHALDADQQSGE
jgi:hypothetical protein